MHPRFGQAYMYMEDKNKGWDVSHMCHVLVWDQNTCDNDYLADVHHTVCCVDQDIAIK